MLSGGGSGPEVFEAPSGAGELEEDVSMDEGEDKCCGTVLVASVERTAMHSGAETVLAAARESAASQAAGREAAERASGSRAGAETREAGAAGGGEVRWSQVGSASCLRGGVWY
eukprot:987105-Rhodomonas_salina.2